MLNLSDITSKIQNVAMFVTADLQTVLCMYLHDLSPYKVLNSSSSGSLVVAAKLYTKDKFRVTIMLLFCAV
jgi:hypothetical protein